MKETKISYNNQVKEKEEAYIENWDVKSDGSVDVDNTGCLEKDEVTLDDGSTYKGEWKLNFRHGKGIYQLTNGDKYDGSFKNDKQHGEGTYHFSNGDSYQGYWKRGKMNGVGKYDDREKGSTYDGEWYQDQ